MIPYIAGEEEKSEQEPLRGDRFYVLNCSRQKGISSDVDVTNQMAWGLNALNTHACFLGTIAVCQFNGPLRHYAMAFLAGALAETAAEYVRDSAAPDLEQLSETIYLILTGSYFTM